MGGLGTQGQFLMRRETRKVGSKGERGRGQVPERSTCYRADSARNRRPMSEAGSSAVCRVEPGPRESEISDGGLGA